MTVVSTSNIIRYIGDDVTTVFPYNFKIFVDTDLEVTEHVIATGVETLLILNTDYTVSGAGDAAGGNVIMVTPPPATKKLIIKRVVPMKQGLDLVDNQSTSMENFEEVYDKLVMMVQDLEERLDRVVTLDISQIASVQLPLPTAGKLIGWNITEDGLENKDRAEGGGIISLIEARVSDPINPEVGRIWLLP